MANIFRLPSAVSKFSHHISMASCFARATALLASFILTPYVSLSSCCPLLRQILYAAFSFSSLMACLPLAPDVYPQISLQVSCKLSWNALHRSPQSGSFSSNLSLNSSQRAGSLSFHIFNFFLPSTFLLFMPVIFMSALTGLCCAAQHTPGMALQSTALRLLAGLISTRSSCVSAPLLT